MGMTMKVYHSHKVLPSGEVLWTAWTGQANSDVHHNSIKQEKALHPTVKLRVASGYDAVKKILKSAASGMRTVHDRLAVLLDQFEDREFGQLYKGDPESPNKHAIERYLRILKEMKECCQNMNLSSVARDDVIYRIEKVQGAYNGVWRDVDCEYDQVDLVDYEWKMEKAIDKVISMARDQDRNEIILSNYDRLQILLEQFEDREFGKLYLKG